MRYSVSSLMDEIWERAVETALDGEKDHASARTLTLDGAVKCIQGRLPPPSLLEKLQNLQHLSIASIGVSSLEQFPKLLKLERLILSDNRIAGGLEFLVEAGLDSLRDLDLSNNRIQHIEDLAPLAQLKLVSLDLYECPVTRVKDYRSRVFKLIESLKYLDKMDLQEKERPESEEEEEDEDDNEDEEVEEEEDEDPGSGEIDGEDRQFVECNGHGEGVGGVVNVDEEQESEAEEEEEDGDGSNRVPNGRVRVEHMEEDGGGENDSGEEIDDDDDDEDFNIDDIRDHFVEVHQVVESDDDEEDGIEYDEDDDEDDDESDDDDDEMGIGNIAQVEFAFDEPLPDTRGLFIDMSGEIDGHEHGEEDGDGDNNGETGEEEIGIEYDPEFDDDDDEEEDLGAGYLVQPVSHSEALNAGINGGNNDEEEEEIDDNDSDDAQVLPPSSSNLKRKRDDDGDEQ